MPRSGNSLIGPRGDLIYAVFVGVVLLITVVVFALMLRHRPGDDDADHKKGS